MDDTNPTRASLLSAAKNDATREMAWRELHRIYFDRLVKKAMSRPGTQIEDAKDGVSETLLELVKQLPKFVYDRKQKSPWISRHDLTPADAENLSSQGKVKRTD